jgi:hypothetical protein
MPLQDLPQRRWGYLASTVFALGFVWLVLLPFIGRQANVAAHITQQQGLGIDPSAMFYTELEVAPTLTKHVEYLRDANQNQFWKTE